MRIVILMCFIVILSGCATNTCNPVEMSTWEILAGKGSRCISSMKTDLATLEQKAGYLRSEINRQQDRLKELDAEESQIIRDHDRSNTELVNINQELYRKRKELNQMQTRSQLLVKQLAEANVTSSTSSAEAQKYQGEIDSLNRDISVLKQSIDRLLNARAQNAIK